MDQEREQILQQLRDAADEGFDSERFYQIMRQALSLRPLPRELLWDILKRYDAIKKPQSRPLTPEREKWLREMMGRIYNPSDRARDPNHPVGAAAQAIRAALPEFQPWQIDLAHVDFSQVVRDRRDAPGRAFAFLHPPDFASETPASYISATQAMLIRDQDGAWFSMGELMRRTPSREAFDAQRKQNSRLSDALLLLWKRIEPLELRAVEELLRSLAQVVAPNAPVRFHPHDEPHYRTGLRMQLGDNLIPAATAGIFSPGPGLPQRVHAACALLYLESWAAARTGQIVELMEMPLPLF